jgi:hypothetical protein
MSVAVAALLGLGSTAIGQQLGVPTLPAPGVTTVGVELGKDKPAKPADPKPAAEPVKTVVVDGCNTGCCDNRCDGWGPAMPGHAKLGLSFMPNCCGHNDKIDIYGWADMGYTYSSRGGGALAVQPRENRFGNEFLVNQLAVVFEKKLRQDHTFNFGFNATFYAGADAALLRPAGGFTTTNQRFGADFRQLFVSAHLPILTEGGMDVQVGRMGTPIGFNSAMAPYRPFYSSDYQWFYAEDGAWTGILTNLHVNKQLDVVNAITMGANTFFTYRGNGPTYLGQVNYWTSEAKTTQLSTSLQVGNQAIFAAGPQFVGSNDVALTFMIVHQWNKCLTQIVQSSLVWGTEVPNIGTSEFYSLYSIWQHHTTKEIDTNFRLEWARDVQGSRIGTRAHFGEASFGFDYHPSKLLRIRPEIRTDFSDRPALGPNGNRQFLLTLGIDAILSF